MSNMVFIVRVLTEDGWPTEIADAVVTASSAYLAINKLYPMAWVSSGGTGHNNRRRYEHSSVPGKFIQAFQSSKKALSNV